MRIIDIGVSVFVLVVLSPIILALIIMIRIKLGSPVFFIQERPGLYSEVFEMYKFRTMTDERNDNGELLPDNKRLTRFGKFLRSTSMDELPEFWNVLKGDMSLIGPRPLLVEYLEYYNTYQMRRHEVKPGITGWAQVNGRNMISWEKKFDLDVWYIDNRSFWLDLKICWLTVYQILKREGISKQGHATTDYFKGSG